MQTSHLRATIAKHLCTVVICSASCLAPAIALAESVLQVLPTRVVLEGPKRAMNVTLINRGDEEGSYRLFFRNIRANEKGEFSEIDTPIEGELFAEEMIRFSPRRITVPPRSKQNVRVVLRKPPTLATGEYRSHLVFRKLPKQDSVLDQGVEENAVGFSLRPIVEVTIPVIVRHGGTTATMQINQAKLETGDGDTASIKMTIQRSGSRSLYGDVDVWWMKADGKKQNIGMAKGIAVYSPNTIREFEMPLDVNNQVLNGGKLLIEFTEDPAYGGDQKADIEVAI